MASSLGVFDLSSENTVFSRQLRCQKSGGLQLRLGPSFLQRQWRIVMHFRIQGLPAEQFAPLFSMSETELAQHGAVRRIADARERGYPCRVSLTDSKPGDELILVNYEHHAVASPYRMRFAIYVRPGEQPFDAVDEVPD